MNAAKPSQSPIMDFLGQEAGAGGPFALLGLLHEITSDDQIIRACNRRLHQIDRHRHRSTPDASEVRLAVHTAASQLLDPALRDQLTKRWPPGIPVALPKAWKPINKATKLTPKFLKNARLLIAASGGWNATARKRLAHFARMNRVSALELVSALNPSPIKQSAQGIKAMNGSTRGSDYIALVDPPPTRSPHWFAAYTLLFVMASAVITTVVLTPPQLGMRESSTVNTSPDERSTRVSAGESDMDPSHTPQNNERTEFSHYTAVAHELDQLVSRSRTNPVESIERFATIYPEFVDSWTVFPMPALERSSSHIAEFSRRIFEAGDFDEFLVPIFECDPMDDDPAKVMIHAAILDTVLFQAGISTNARTQLAVIRKRCSGNEPRPTQDISAALIPIAGILGTDSKTDDPFWWSKWAKAVQAATSEDEPQRTRLILSAMSARLRDASPPTRNWRKTVAELINTVSWREGTPERFWLLRQIVDETVSTERLATFTEALATDSSAKQINVQMVLNPSATFLQRQALAQEYKAVWNTSSTQADQPDDFNELITAMHLRVSITPNQMDESQAIDAIIELARLNSAAWQFAAGEDSIAAQTLQTVEDTASSQTQPQVLNISMNQRDTLWAQEAINAKSANELSSLFAQLVQDSGPGANSAHALVYIASLNADSELRSLAAAQVARYKQSPSILLALDHAIAGRRISTRLEQLVLRVVDLPLPPRTDESWYLQAHQMLLRLTARSLARTVDSNLPLLEQELGMAYAMRDTNSLKSDHSVKSTVSVARHVYLQMLLKTRSAELPNQMNEDPTRLIESALTVRLRRSTSPMHHFYGYQRAICELHALSFDREIPGASIPIRDLLAQLTMRLDRSRSVIEQVALVERCIAELWILRLEGGRP